MVRFDDSVGYEMENQSFASGRHVCVNRCSGDDDATGAAPVKSHPTGRKHLRLITVSFGLLCLLQATLNVTLRLTLPTKRNLTDSCDEITQHFEIVIKNMADENKKLKRTQDIFVEYIQQGWLYINNSFYYKSNTKKSWQESRQYCLQKGADLMIINSKEEQNVARKYRPVWIGLTDNEKEGVWKWVDGTPLSTSYWSAGEPNDADGGENCGEIGYYETLNSWNDMPCQHNNYWICEKVAM